MAEFHIDEPREIGKKKDRLSSKEKNMLKAMNIESIIQDNTCIHCENIVDENLRKSSVINAQTVCMPISSLQVSHFPFLKKPVNGFLLQDISEFPRTFLAIFKRLPFLVHEFL